MKVEELDTPAVIVNLDVMERNLAQLAAYCSQHHMKLRPHTKTHKIPELARRQLAGGAVGITVAKVGEAEIMVDSGINDILIASPIVNPRKARRVASLAERARITVSLDSEEAARALSQQALELDAKIGILVEIDVGLHRCGVPDEQAAVALARIIAGLKGLELRGLMFYPGHLLVPPHQQRAMIWPINDLLGKTMEAFRHIGLPTETVSGGSTPTAYLSHEFRGMTEIRPGMYIFNDRNMLGARVARFEDCALSVLVTVVSTAVSGRAVVDGGSKTFSSDRFLAGDGIGFGAVAEDPHAVFESMSEEHGHFNIVQSERIYRVGERLTIIPNHVCATINLHDEIYGVRGLQVESVWKVAARGRVQ